LAHFVRLYFGVILRFWGGLGFGFGFSPVLKRQRGRAEKRKKKGGGKRTESLAGRGVE
jgi:hypothetical protein